MPSRPRPLDLQTRQRAVSNNSEKKELERGSNSRSKGEASAHRVQMARILQEVDDDFWVGGLAIGSMVFLILCCACCRGRCRSRNQTGRRKQVIELASAHAAACQPTASCFFSQSRPANISTIPSAVATRVVSSQEPVPIGEPVQVQVRVPVFQPES